MNKLTLAALLPLLCAFASSAERANEDAERAECARVMQKFPDARLIETLKTSGDFFIAVIKYNAVWGAFPNYIYVKQTNKPLEMGKVSVVYLDECKAAKICGAIAKNISFENPVEFISRGKTSIPAIFDEVVIYKSGKIKRIVLNQVSQNNADIADLAPCGAFTLLRELALITGTHSMFESICGVAPMP